MQTEFKQAIATGQLLETQLCPAARGCCFSPLVRGRASHTECGQIREQATLCGPSTGTRAQPRPCVSPAVTSEASTGLSHEAARRQT